MVKGTRAKLGYFPDNLDPPVLSEIIWIMPLMIWNCLSEWDKPPPPYSRVWSEFPLHCEKQLKTTTFSGKGGKDDEWKPQEKVLGKVA